MKHGISLILQGVIYGGCFCSYLPQTLVQDEVQKDISVDLKPRDHEDDHIEPWVVDSVRFFIQYVFVKIILFLPIFLF